MNIIQNLFFRLVSNLFCSRTSQKRKVTKTKHFGYLVNTLEGNEPDPDECRHNIGAGGENGAVFGVLRSLSVVYLPARPPFVSTQQNLLKYRTFQNVHLRNPIWTFYSRSETDGGSNTGF